MKNKRLLIIMGFALILFLFSIPTILAFPFIHIFSDGMLNKPEEIGAENLTNLQSYVAENFHTSAWKVYKVTNVSVQDTSAYKVCIALVKAPFGLLLNTASAKYLISFSDNSFQMRFVDSAPCLADLN